MKLSCDKCSKIWPSAKPEQAGMTHLGCGGSWVEPEVTEQPAKPAGPPQPKGPLLRLTCSACGATWSGDESFIGKKHTNPKCGKGLWMKAEAISSDSSFRTASGVLVPMFKPNRDYMLWKRGEWRGWAVSSVLGFVDTFVRMERDYNIDNPTTVLESRLIREIQEGTTYVVNPIGVIELLLHQLSRFSPTPELRALAETLTLAQSQYEGLKQTFDDAANAYVRPELSPDLTEGSIEFG